MITCEKKGIIFQPDKNHWWSQKYAMMPTPVSIPEKNIIRIYYSSVDKNNDGRISFIDVNENNPSEILYRYDKPSLEIGKPGTFDDSGVSPSCVFIEKNIFHLFYVGFQRTEKVPYMLFSGHAISNDGMNFTRVSESPLLDRHPENFLSNAAPFILKNNDKYLMWFWMGTKWVEINSKKYIQASIALSESHDLMNWKNIKSDCINPDKNKSEFSVGRPWIIKKNNSFHCFYSTRYKEKLYRITYAQSTDGLMWTNKKENIVEVSANGWDSEMTCYSSLIEIKDKVFLFYNGNNNGATGFGYAIVEGL